MKIGTLYKVIRNGHTYPQVGDVIACLKQVGGVDLYLLGLNLRTNKRHHYHIDNLEVICK